MSHRARILVVDDTPATLYATTKILRAQGFEIVEAETGTEALERADRAIDLVVLDVQLPDIHGFEVCRRLRERDTTALLPVVHLSATFAADSDRAEGLDAGADGYLTHPVEPIVLIATINTLLRARRAEDEHRRSEERFREFFQVSPIGIGLLDDNGVLMEANPALSRLLARPREDLVGLRFRDFALPEGRANLERAISAPLGAASRQSFGLRRSDDSVAAVELQVQALPRSTMRLAMATDMTEQRRYQAEREQLLASERAARADAERVNRLKDQFIAVLGHELRNPLAAIVSGVEVLKHGGANEEQRKWLQDGIARQSARLKSLINDLLDTSRLSHGKLSLKRERVYLAEVVGRAVESCSELIEGRAHVLTVAVEPPDLALDADALRLEQIVVNLLTNAANYTPEGGRIWLEAKAVGDTAELFVSDTGAGLGESEKSAIFEAFAQAGEPGQGLGIGLTLVRQLVELHGGSVRAESEGPGKGSTFRVTLPLTSGEALAIGDDVERPSLTVAVRTLIIDDNETAALMLQALLQNKGYTTEVAHSGGSAIGIARDFEPELVLLDIGLPDMSGYEVAERLREAGLKDATIAALSGYGRELAQTPSAEARFDAHLVKPASFEEIQALAASIVARRG